MKSFPLKIDSSKNNFKIGSINKGILIYGAGDLGKLALDYCEKNNITVLGILDSNKTGIIKSKINKYKIKNPYYLKNNYYFKIPLIIAIANYPIEPIFKNLLKIGWKNISPFYAITNCGRKNHPLRNGWEIGKFSNNEINNIKQIVKKFSDNDSIKHYEAFIQWHLNCKEVNLENKINIDNRYLIPEFIDKLIKSKRNNLLVDIGAHKAQLIKKFNNLNLFFNNYLIFEPDTKSRNFIKNNKKNIFVGKCNIKISKKILYNTNDYVYFEEGLDYCSQIWSKSKKKFNSYTLDSLNIKPDIIKVHTEGSETAILMGSINTIKKYNPFIVFSVYHRRKGFYSDILKPMEIFKDYYWFFRLHAYQGTGAFVYAVPKKKLQPNG